MDNKKLWESFLNHLLNEGVTQKRINKLKLMFNTASRGLPKGYENSNRKDIEKFLEGLNKGLFKNLKGEDYSGSTKADIKKFIKQFYKWFKGNNEIYPPEVLWIKTNIRKDERPKPKEILSLKELNLFVSGFNKLEYRMLMLMLFDSGFRIQEMLSVKKKDLIWDNFDDDNKCFWIKCNESKTLLRKIPIPLFSEDIQSFVNSSSFMSKDNDSLLFDIKYSNILKQMKNISEKVFLKKKYITPHSLRHSSATYYASVYEGNVPLLAGRYGWSYSAKELQTYVRESGAYQKQGAKKVFANEMQKLREQNAKLKERLDKIEKAQNIILQELALRKIIKN